MLVRQTSTSDQSVDSSYTRSSGGSTSITLPEIVPGGSTTKPRKINHNVGAVALSTTKYSKPYPWNCHCCTARNEAGAVKCRVCGRPESYAERGYGMPFHGSNAALFRPSQTIHVLESVHEADSIGWTALHSACALGNTLIVAELLANKAKVDALTNHGQSVLHLAVNARSVECVKLLLRQPGIPVHAVTSNEKNTALHLACEFGEPVIAQMLLDAGADVHATNILLRTPLHSAAISGRADIGLMLLKAGAKRTQADAQSWDATQIAELYGHRMFCEFLIREGLTVKQAVLKEMPEQPWHSTLWSGVTKMYTQRKGELEHEQRLKQQDLDLKESLQKQRKDAVIEARKKERADEINLYNSLKIAEIKKRIELEAAYDLKNSSKHLAIEDHNEKAEREQRLIESQRKEKHAMLVHSLSALGADMSVSSKISANSKSVSIVVPSTTSSDGLNPVAYQPANSSIHSDGSTGSMIVSVNSRNNVNKSVNSNSTQRSTGSRPPVVGTAADNFLGVPRLGASRSMSQRRLGRSTSRAGDSFRGSIDSNDSISESADVQDDE